MVRNGQQQTETDRTRQKLTKPHRNAQKQTKTDRSGQKQTDANRNRQKHTEAEKRGQKQEEEKTRKNEKNNHLSCITCHMPINNKSFRYFFIFILCLKLHFVS